MIKFIRLLSCLIFCAIAAKVPAQSPPPSTKLKDQVRLPWMRTQERFIRGPWQISAELPLSNSADALDLDPILASGGEAALSPEASALKWRSVTFWGDFIDLSDGSGLKRDLVAYATTTIKRMSAGRARLCLGSDEGMRAWVNGIQVLNHHGPRPLTCDEDQVEVDFKAGDNLLLIKVEQRTGPWGFVARVLESGSVPPRLQEIAPSYSAAGTSLTIKTDINAAHVDEEKVTVQVVAAGGKILTEATAPRGGSILFDGASWPDGPYEIRCVTRKPDGLRYSTHLTWFKGDAMAAARELIEASAAADVSTPAGQTIKMLGDMVLDRLGKDGLATSGNPWWAIHSPLMEYAELKLETSGQKLARAHPGGFYRLAWRDEIDGSPQFARAYLPIGYDPAKKTPLVVRLHGFNPANPDYVRWWAADMRHSFPDIEFGQGEGLIYLEPHGRGNSQYLGLGDGDILRAIAEAKAHLNVDEDRVYLCGDSMGGWGTWNVGTRHPDVFAALAPIYGGVDYHCYLTEEQLIALSPLDRFLLEADSTQAFADGLLNLPVMVLHGDADSAVNVEWSRYNVHMLQRWGYDVRYVELPGYGHEDISRFAFIFDWFLRHRRDPNPAHVRLRSAELKNASAYWLRADQAGRPDDFMIADAEIIAPNTIRLDTQNIRALTLSPNHRLIDLTKPVQVVWNGEPRTVAASASRLALQAVGYDPGVQPKTFRLAGAIGEIYNVPFAIVTGTAAADPAMNEVCRRKTEILIQMWHDWQRQPVRVFKDSEITDADAARYSLILIGGPDANLVSRKLAGKLPLKISAEAIEIGGRSFPVKNGRVEMIHPNPLNPQNYVLIVAATSTAGMQFWSPLDIRNATFDFVVEDGCVASLGQKAYRTELWVAGGWFDGNWALVDSLVYPGKPEVRAKGLTLRGPLATGLLAAYSGRYEFTPNVPFEIKHSGLQLLAALPGEPERELIPAQDGSFFVLDGSMMMVFVKDPDGKITSLKATRPGREFTCKRLD